MSITYPFTPPPHKYFCLPVANWNTFATTHYIYSSYLLSLSLFHCLYIGRSVYLSIYLSVYLFIYLSFHLLIYLLPLLSKSVSNFKSLFICLFNTLHKATICIFFIFYYFLYFIFLKPPSSFKKTNLCFSFIRQSLYNSIISLNISMYKTQNSKKTGFWFLIIKVAVFNIFKNGKKLHSLQLYTSSVCIWVTIVPHEKCFHATIRYVFAFLPQKGALILKMLKNGWPHKFYCPKDSKKVHIFEIGSLQVYDRRGGGGCQGSTLYCVLTSIYICMYHA